MNGGNKKKLCVTIPVKPYCYRFLCNNFGIKGEKEGYISLHRNSLLGMVFRALLHHKTRISSAAPLNHSRWCTKSVYVKIWVHDLDHHGLDLTEQGKKEWAMIVERMCLEDFKQFFIHMYMVEPHKNLIIEKYQRLRGYTEEDWPLESMEKIVTRMNIIHSLKRSREEFLNKFNGFFTANLSAMVDYRITKNILSRLCDSTLTTEEESAMCTQFLQNASATSEIIGTEKPSPQN